MVAPPVHGRFDYQIGGPYQPDASVAIVDRDRLVSPVSGKYNICYLNALQSQPDPDDSSSAPAEGTLSWWADQHPDLVVKGQDGHPVIDQEWNEAVLDVSTADKRAKILEIEKPWIDGCRRSGFQAIEPDNLDSYNRSHGTFPFAADRDFMVAFVRYAHSRGLAVGQKNANHEYGRLGRTVVGFDFAIAEECSYYHECGEYAAAYGNNYIDIEYSDQGESPFRAACQDHGAHASVILRDRHVAPKADPAYRYETC
ncbi:endo alpha-1,4 polygalactosaminidase [Fodinicola feengrottensis]|uniref:endo alpha-1,4 polygalactosaminidase n=1 Tax=Fodinicola feengrottensis TaxID=435914 RepID=UPI0013CF700E|nr:endo alpha-1,4 polygalactosaminidase [Fodinicola feengrottensis]